MADGRTVRVQLDVELLREARRVLGAGSNKKAVELAITIALAIRAPGSPEATKYLEILRSDRFKI